MAGAGAARFLILPALTATARAGRTALAFRLGRVGAARPPLALIRAGFGAAGLSTARLRSVRRSAVWLRSTGRGAARFRTARFLLFVHLSSVNVRGQGAHKRQMPELFGIVESVAHHELIGNIKA